MLPETVSLADIIDVTLADEPFKADVTRDPSYFTENWRAWESGDTEQELYSFIARHADPKGVFLDVGSWQGSAALLASRKYRKVFAFEADPTSVEALQDNIRVNNADNITIVPKFVGDRKGTQSFYSMDHGNNAGSSAFHTEGKTRWEVETVRLDEFIADVGCSGDPIYLKIDIEGAEYMMLDALRKTLQKFDVRCICLSLHPFLLAKQVKGQSLYSKLRRRALVVSRTLRILSIVRSYRNVADADGHPITRRRLVWSAIRKGRHEVRESEIYLT